MSMSVCIYKVQKHIATHLVIFRRSKTVFLDAPIKIQEHSQKHILNRAILM